MNSLSYNKWGLNLLRRATSHWSACRVGAYIIIYGKIAELNSWSSQIRYHHCRLLNQPVDGNERAEVLAKTALYKSKQFYYIYLILILSIDILQVEWNIKVTSKVFEVLPTIKRSRFYPNAMECRNGVVLCSAMTFICLKISNIRPTICITTIMFICKNNFRNEFLIP